MKPSSLCFALGVAPLVAGAPVPALRSMGISHKPGPRTVRHDISTSPGYITPDHQLDRDHFPPIPNLSIPKPGHHGPPHDGTELYPTYPPESVRAKSLFGERNDMLAAYLVVVFVAAVVIMETWSWVFCR